jgi:hypothetical protein
MAVPYNPNVPLAKDLINVSQGDFLNNFGDLYKAFLVNHVALDAASNAGNHTVVELTEQTAPFQTDAGEISIYTRDAPGQTDQIFMQFQGNQTEFQYTNYQIYSINATSTQTSYFTFLPGRILIYFGMMTPSSTTFKLLLNPQIAKNIISANFCPIGPASSITNYPPNVVAESGIPNIYTALICTSSFLIQNVPPCYYFVMANV